VERRTRQAGRSLRPLFALWSRRTLRARRPLWPRITFVALIPFRTCADAFREYTEDGHRVRAGHRCISLCTTQHEGDATRACNRRRLQDAEPGSVQDRRVPPIVTNTRELSGEKLM
jgi:hypothetical protein